MKLLFALMLSCFVSGAFADGAGQVVSERMSCADISARVSEIGKIDEPTEAETAELTKLKAEYRRTCTKSARGRRTSGEARIVVEATATPEEVSTVVSSPWYSLPALSRILSAMVITSALPAERSPLALPGIPARSSARVPTGIIPPRAARSATCFAGSKK